MGANRTAQSTMHNVTTQRRGAGQLRLQSIQKNVDIRLCYLVSAKLNKRGNSRAEIKERTKIMKSISGGNEICQK